MIWIPKAGETGSICVFLTRNTELTEWRQWCPIICMKTKPARFVILVSQSQRGWPHIWHHRWNERWDFLHDSSLCLHSVWHTGPTLERRIVTWWAVCQAGLLTQTLSSYMRPLLSAAASGDDTHRMAEKIVLILNNHIKFPYKWFSVILEHSECTESMCGIRKEHNHMHQPLLWCLRKHF